ncbi:MAG: GDP-mannose 4,6-dehydratase [Candidatus Ranarchaeia archaeon]
MKAEGKVLVTGGAGFIGSHVAEFHAKRGNDVIVFDNLSRTQLLGKGYKNANYNWNCLKKYGNIKLVKADLTDLEKLKETCKDVDAIIHAAAQTAVTTSLIDPRTDFMINALGTFNILEAARKYCNDPAIIFCSTNKVYGSNINEVNVLEKETKYLFEDRFKNGISETFSTDLCEHTPYGCSKLAGDLYTQDYAKIYGLKTAVFRMSCIYGTRQFGVEDQGWVAWFTIATITGKPITIYGDGKQVRDVLYISDLIQAFDVFLQRKNQLMGEVFNMGGGPENTLSLLELLNLLEQLTGKRSKINFSKWRPSDQKVFISNTTKAKEKLGWAPKINPKEGIKMLVNWVSENKRLFT